MLNFLPRFVLTSTLLGNRQVESLKPCTAPELYLGFFNVEGWEDFKLEHFHI